MVKTERFRGGYRELRFDHPLVVASPVDHLALASRANRWIGEHRVVAACVLGRELSKEETVHHVNGEKADNRPENLEVWDSREHSREHKRIFNELIRLRAENKRLRAELAHRGGNEYGTGFYVWRELPGRV